MATGDTPAREAAAGPPGGWLTCQSRSTNISEQVAGLIGESFDYLIGQHFTTGTNDGPTGIVTALVGGGQEIAQAAVYRTGTVIELVPHTFGTSGGGPRGQRGFFAYTRVGGDVTVDSAFVMLNVGTTA